MAAAAVAELATCRSGSFPCSVPTLSTPIAGAGTGSNVPPPPIFGVSSSSADDMVAALKYLAVSRYAGTGLIYSFVEESRHLEVGLPLGGPAFQSHVVAR